MKKILIFVSIIMIILLMLSSKKDYYVIPDESIRFRIIANSNSTNDQYVKIKVKDVLEKEVTNDLKESNTIETSRIIIEKNMDKYKNKVKETLEDLNYNSTFTINFGDNYFPEKEYKDVMASSIPMGRLGKDSEIANLICYLLSDEASFITGDIVSIDGGFTAA